MIDISSLQKALIDSIDDIIVKSKENGLEATFSISSDGTFELTVKPFVPFRYSCPYACESKNGD